MIEEINPKNEYLESEDEKYHKKYKPDDLTQKLDKSETSEALTKSEAKGSINQLQTIKSECINVSKES